MRVTEATHTPEPWTYDQEYRWLNVGGDPTDESGPLTVVGNDGETEVCWMTGIDDEKSAMYEMRYSPEAWANARRIVACVNACEGISVRALEASVIKKLLDSLESFFHYARCDHEDLGLQTFRINSGILNDMYEAFAMARPEDGAAS